MMAKVCGVWKHWHFGVIEVPYALTSCQRKLMQFVLGMFGNLLYTMYFLQEWMERSHRHSIFVKSDCSLLRFKCVYSNCIFWFRRNSLMQWWSTFSNLILHLDFCSDLLYGSSNPLEQHPPPQINSEFPWSPAKRYRGQTEELSLG